MTNCAKCSRPLDRSGATPDAAWRLCDQKNGVDHVYCVPCFDAAIMYGPGWPGAPVPAAATESYTPLPPDDATQVLLDVYQGKYHRASYQDRVKALEKDGLVICRKN